jgi:hypothetical protein
MSNSEVLVGYAAHRFSLHACGRNLRGSLRAGMTHVAVAASASARHVGALRTSARWRQSVLKSLVSIWTIGSLLPGGGG